MIPIVRENLANCQELSRISVNYAPNFEKVEGAYCYASNFEKVEGEYCFGLVSPSVLPSFHPLQIKDRVLKFHRWTQHKLEMCPWDMDAPAIAKFV